MSYQLYISRASPYSSKIVALLGYTDLEHQLRIQNAVNRYTVIRRLTGKTMVPVLRRGEWAINDSTEIAKYAMARSARPTLPMRPYETLAWFFEDFADEWMVRWMVHSRWHHREDAERAAELIGRELTGRVPVGAKLLGRQVARLLRRQVELWGVRPGNDRALHNSSLRCLEALEAVVSTRPAYLFADYPTVADFAIYGALIQYQSDPTGRQRLYNYPALLRYLRRMDGMAERPPTVESVPGGERDIRELQPLFAEMMGTYWPVMVANYRNRFAEVERRDVVAGLVDGSEFAYRQSSYLERRLQSLLELVDGAYASRDRLFGEAGMRMERALVGHIAELCESEAGRRLLRQYQHVGMH